MNLDGRVAIVTGAATGIGAALAKGLASDGAAVIGLDIAWSETSEPVSGIEQVKCDVADQSSVERCVADIEARRGAVDILVNNAAIASALAPKPFEQITVEEWKHVIDVNTLAPFLCSRAVAPRMRERKWGRIVNLTSAGIFTSVPNNLHYYASKGAIAVMTRALASELGGDGITVNAIAPGLTVTQGIEGNDAYSDAFRKQIVGMRCIHREEHAEDLVGACNFLASEAAAFITGQILTVDGGLVFH